MFRDRRLRIHWLRKLSAIFFFACARRKSLARLIYARWFRARHYSLGFVFSLTTRPKKKKIRRRTRRPLGPGEEKKVFEIKYKKKYRPSPRRQWQSHATWFARTPAPYVQRNGKKLTDDDDVLSRAVGTHDLPGCWGAVPEEKLIESLWISSTRACTTEMIFFLSFFI